MVESFKQEMKDCFEMTNLGLLNYFLGLEVKQNQREIFITQRRYAEETLKLFQMQHCNPVCTPMKCSEKLQSNDNSGDADSKVYISLIGRLLYLTHTRPDIACTVNLLSRFVSKPTKTHLGAAKYLLRYIAGTTNFGINYTEVKKWKLRGYSDSDWGGSIDDRRSTLGMVFDLSSWAISWSSKKQEVTALSTTEAEYVAATAATCQGIWLRRMLEDCGMKGDKAIEVWCDNRSAIEIAKNPTHHGRTKHIDIRFHFICGLVADGLIVLKYCKSEDQKADILTKSLLVKKHNYMRTHLGVEEVSSKEGCCKVLETGFEEVDWSAIQGTQCGEEKGRLTCQLTNSMDASPLSIQGATHIKGAERSLAVTAAQ
ncbi:uncharacterized mitochondrial protein AtMg00810-like [Dioscorea cayenensis subsp. rotundata]|uniref:Uncharacterized mitochondrial protein AtMg00810-like n=1 Tax=Dioscorea cayennensis subsp. rotundata TaxID=55577 RepID=A0AB40C357_DIOCR|nr:uncharacterized mitochondrial protein AtMg00810-like [Dioscorea cayenensis subsp. rotundata]